MVNENIQSAIPLAGRGYQNRKHGEYLPGEYKTLLNAEINKDGFLVNRRNVAALTGNTIAHAQCFIGNLSRYAIIRNRDNHSVIGADGTNLNLSGWGSPKLISTTYASNTSWIASHELVGAFQYNKTNYWLSYCITNVGGSFTQLKLDVILHTQTSLTPNSVYYPSNSVWAHDGCSHTTIYTVTMPYTYDLGDIPQFKGFLLHKERLWVLMTDRAIFTKAGTLTTTATPDGGFFLFNDFRAETFIALEDTIYVAGISTLMSITYTTDPNTNSSVSRISNVLGTTSFAVYENTVYFTYDDGLYSLTGTSVYKVLDLNIKFNMTYGTNPKMSLFAFGSYIVIQQYLDTRVFGHSVYGQTRRALYQTKFPPYVPASPGSTDSYEFIMPPNIYFLNMENGSIHQFATAELVDVYSTISDDINKDNMARQSRVIDMYFMPLPNDLNRTTMFFLMSKGHDVTVPTSTSLDTIGSVLVMENRELDSGNNISASSEESTFYDVNLVQGHTSNIAYIAPRVVIEIEDFAPDGLSYYFKKFRNLLVEAEWPDSLLYYNLWIKYGANAYKKVSTFGKYSVVGVRIKSGGIESSRFGLNQRAKSISVRIQGGPTYFLSFDVTEAEKTNFLIRDLRLLWSYTARVVTGNKNVDKS